MKKSNKAPALSAIREFLSCKHYAVAGVSRDPKKFGNVIFREMVKKGYKVVPVNPNSTEIEGHPCYPGIHELPVEIEALVIVTPPSQTIQILRDAADKGISHIWIQPGAEDLEVLTFCLQNQGQYVTRNCILMYLEPVSGIHKLHRFFNKLFGVYPT